MEQPEKIKRDEKTERAVWNKHIQPIVDIHNIDLSYRYFQEPEHITEMQIYRFEREIMDACNIFATNDFVNEVLKPLKYGTIKTLSKAGETNLLLYFDQFMAALIKGEFNGLGFPYFLEWLRRESEFEPKLNVNGNDELIEEEINKICPELERFMRKLKEEIDLIGQTFIDLEEDELQKIANDYFNRDSSSYHLIKSNYLKKDVFKKVERRRRRIIGAILQQHLVTSLEIDKTPSIDSLFKRHNAIIKKT